eukprot:TRINITY_DN506_c0_g1_i6.p1 TRINITY_DN506_c0_g1~~TRINITY_DN506_c0_g1_i6.p1  ORF type:complete len:2055 (-),score=546.94 TRINITY_DN506_c0_g1_i6:42-5438(-)
MNGTSSLVIGGILSGVGKISTSAAVITGSISINGNAQIDSALSVTNSSISASSLVFNNNLLKITSSINSVGTFFAGSSLSSSGSLTLNGSLSFNGESFLNGFLNNTGTLNIQTGRFSVLGSAFSSNNLTVSFSSSPNLFQAIGLNVNSGSLIVSPSLVNLTSIDSSTTANFLKMNVPSFLSFQTGLNVLGSFLLNQNCFTTLGDTILDGTISSSFLNLNGYSMNGTGSITNSKVSLNGIFSSIGLYLTSTLESNGTFQSSGSLNFNNESISTGNFLSSGTLNIQTGLFSVVGSLSAASNLTVSFPSSPNLFQATGGLNLNSGSINISPSLFNLTSLNSLSTISSLKMNVPSFLSFQTDLNVLGSFLLNQESFTTSGNTSLIGTISSNFLTLNGYSMMNGIGSITNSQISFDGLFSSNQLMGTLSNLFLNSSVSSNGNFLASTSNVLSNGILQLDGLLNFKNETILNGILTNGDLSIQTGFFSILGSLSSDNLTVSFSSSPNLFQALGGLNLNNGILNILPSLVNLTSLNSLSTISSLKMNVPSFLSFQIDLNVLGSFLLNQESFTTSGNTSLIGTISSTILRLDGYLMNGTGSITNSQISFDGIFSSNLLTNTLSNLFLNSSVSSNGNFLASTSNVLSNGILQLDGLLNFKNETILNGILTNGDLSIQTGLFSILGSLSSDNLTVSFSSSPNLFQALGGLNLNNGILNILPSLVNLTSLNSLSTANILNMNVPSFLSFQTDMNVLGSFLLNQESFTTSGNTSLIGTISSTILRLDGYLMNGTGSITNSQISFDGIFSSNLLTNTLSNLFLNSSVSSNGNFLASTSNVLSNGILQLDGLLNFKNETILNGILSNGNLSIQTGLFSILGSLSSNNLTVSFSSSPNLFQALGGLNLNNGSLNILPSLVNLTSLYSYSTANLLILNIPSFLSFQTDMNVLGSLQVNQSILTTLGNVILKGPISSTILRLDGYLMNGTGSITNSQILLDGIFSSNLLTNTLSNLFINSSILSNGNLLTTASGILSRGVLHLNGLLNVNNETILNGVLNTTGSLVAEVGSFVINGTLFSSESFLYNVLTLNQTLFQTNGSFFLDSGILSLISSTFDLRGILRSTGTLLLSDASLGAGLISLDGFLINGTTTLIKGILSLGGELVVNGSSLLSSYRTLNLKDTTFKGVGEIISAGYFLWNVSDLSTFQIPLKIGVDVTNFINNSTRRGVNTRGLISTRSIQASIGTGSSSEIVFEDDVHFASTPFAFKNMKIKYLKQARFDKSIFSLVNSNIQIVNQIIFNQSSFIPYITPTTSTPFLTANNLGWFDTSGVFNNKTSNDVFTHSSIFPTISPDYPLTNLPQLILISTFNSSTNRPILEQSIGSATLALSSSSNQHSVSINKCSSQNAACSCKSTSAPLSTYICDKGVWKDDGLAAPVVVSESLVKDRVEVSTLFIGNPDHVLSIVIDDPDLISSTKPIITVNEFALLDGFLNIILNDKNFDLSSILVKPTSAPTSAPSTVSPSTLSPSTSSPTTNFPTTTPQTNSPSTSSPTTSSTTTSPGTTLPSNSPTTSTPAGSPTTPGVPTTSVNSDSPTTSPDTTSPTNSPTTTSTTGSTSNPQTNIPSTTLPSSPSTTSPTTSGSQTNTPSTTSPTTSPTTSTTTSTTNPQTNSPSTTSPTNTPTTDPNNKEITFIIMTSSSTNNTSFKGVNVTTTSGCQYGNPTVNQGQNSLIVSFSISSKNCSGSKGASRNLIIGLSVGVSAFAILAVVISILVYKFVEKRRAREYANELVGQSMFDLRASLGSQTQRDLNSPKTIL